MKKPGKTILQVRDVPDDIHKAAKYAALDAGISLNKWLVEAIRKAVNTEKGEWNHEFYPLN